MRRTALTTLVLGAVLRATAQVSDFGQAADIIAQLEDAPTSADRFNLLNGRDVRSQRSLIIHGTMLTHDPPQFVFDFDAGVGVGKGAGGNITVAILADFPYLVGQGMSLTVGKMAYVSLSPLVPHRSKPFLMSTGLADWPRLTSTHVPPNSCTCYPDRTSKSVSSKKTGRDSSPTSSTPVREPSSRRGPSTTR